MKTIKLEFINTENNISLIDALNKNLGLNFVVCKKLLRKKDIRINGKKIGENCVICKDDVISCFILQNFDILYEDDNILLVNKPKHIETISLSSQNSLTHQLKQCYNYCEPCNRLDTNTTGINVFALNKQSEDEIKKAFKEDRVTKKYIAVASGNIKECELFRDYLVKNENSSTVKVYGEQIDNSLEIVTEYKKLKRINEDLYLIEVTLHTGKTHQIRAHLGFHDIYILGDEKYGNRELNKKYNKHTQILISFFIAFDFLSGSKLQYISGRQFMLNINIDDFKL